MSEYTEVEQPFLQQLAAQGWTVIDQGTEIAGMFTKTNLLQILRTCAVFKDTEGGPCTLVFPTTFYKSNLIPCASGSVLP